ncbi:MAG: phage terminase small subunit [Pseudomonadota bacterium]|nr:phage terminase small subunit [Pseudomonadota bacterium]
MALSPARLHMERVRAAQAASGTGFGELMPETGIVGQLMLQLAQDRARLKQIQSTEGKVALKTELVAAYEPYVDGVLEAGQGAEDPIIAEMLIWHLDIGQYPRALQIADYVLGHSMPMPDRFARTPGCLVAEEIAEAALTAQRLGNAFDLALLSHTADLTENHDMPDQVRAKLHLAAGRALLAGINDSPPTGDQLGDAVSHFKRAIELHPACGGKKDLERAQRELKKSASPKAG